VSILSWAGSTCVTASARIACLAALMCAVAGAPHARAQGTPSPDADPIKAGADKAINLCSTCHGPRGISTSPEFPVLGGQQHDYLVAQLEAFRAKTRAEQIAHDFMWGIAGGLDDRMIDAVASYYAAQPPAPGRPGDPRLIEEGRSLYEKGAVGRGIPSCSTCHGPQAQGAGMFPRLGGQHAKYVRKQLEYIQGLVRNAPVMHGVVKDLTPAEIEAVAAYVQSL
jgi:cytochrome c553